MRILSFFFIISLFSGCTTPNSINYQLSAEQAAANRASAARIQQEDRDADHIERMRQADAIARATRNNRPDTIIIVP